MARPLDAETRAFWEKAWTALEKVDRATRRGDSWRRQVNALVDLAVERRIVGLSRSDEQDLFRTRLLQWHLERVQGRSDDPVEPSRAAVWWLAAEPWLAARALPPGAARTSAMLLALEDGDAADVVARCAAAEQQAREELAGGNATGAARLAERVDALHPTRERLALRAWALAQAGRARDPGPAWIERHARALQGVDAEVARLGAAKLALSCGDDMHARAELGAALARASTDAASLTARLLVAGGESRRARVLTRAWIEDGASRDVPAALWALACLAELPGSAAPRIPPPTAPPLR